MIIDSIRVYDRVLIRNPGDRLILIGTYTHPGYEQMVDFGSLGNVVGGALNSPEGKEQIMKFITSPEGMAMLQKFVGSPDGKQLAGQLLMPILGNLGVPDAAKQTLMQYIPK